MSVVAQPAACRISPKDKRLQSKRVGDDLIRNYGKRKFYTIDQVRESNRRAGVSIDVACWSHAMFNSHSDFDQLHVASGEACDYIAMKSEMLHAVASETSSVWFDFDLSWLEFPDLDISIFDFFD
jgi:hypothetical protein